MALTFAKPIQLRERACSSNGMPGELQSPYVNLFVKVTNRCNARCPFCCNGDALRNQTSFDTGKLFDIIDELTRRNIRINRVAITGGEPSVVPELVEEILRLLSRREYAWIHAHLNTNGLRQESRELMQNSRWNSISVSLHHYDTEALQVLYGLKHKVEMPVFDGIDVSKVNASCNLVKGYIDHPEALQKMMSFALGQGLPRLGLVGLMPMNDYCREHYVDFSALKLGSIPHLYQTGSKCYGSDCKCANYLYNENGRVLEVYLRNLMNPCFVASGLMYDGTHLHQGFGKEAIIC